MQQTFIDKFRYDINNVRKYIEYINLSNNIAITHRDSTVELLKELGEHLKIFNTEKKIFEYKSIVISIYGLLEEHIRIWIKEHINNIPSLITNYDSLPEKIRENNFDLSINLITLISKNKLSQYENIDRASILTNLSDCINSKLGYLLNSEAFSPISGNLKHSKISDAFKAADINLSEKLRTNKEFFEFLSEKYGNNIANKGDELLFSEIDKIVERRNEIAHGSRIENILNINEFSDVLEFIEKYGEAVFAVIEDKEIEYEVDFSCRKYNIKKVFHKGTVVCFEAECIDIKIGDIIFVKTYDSNYSKLQVLEIRNKNEKVERLNIDQKLDVCIKIQGKISENQELFVKDKSIQPEAPA